MTGKQRQNCLKHLRRVLAPLPHILLAGVDNWQDEFQCTFVVAPSDVGWKIRSAEIVPLLPDKYPKEYKRRYAPLFDK